MHPLTEGFEARDKAMVYLIRVLDLNKQSSRLTTRLLITCIYALLDVVAAHHTLTRLFLLSSFFGCLQGQIAKWTWYHGRHCSQAPPAAEEVPVYGCYMPLYAATYR
ncbi:predicted protein [Lichtheimia corymbifera JMRC:FSU:9682]|uniref:Uncharacterized protein n=1 Tax=Lichtheimia corymbifera JMRC:FSU:9682 TaxID=1263082 RepID=A0A068S6T8_9FUNG|nr:predicted protein [Lichtheimia corymbifera JMRC:FSU:9682]